jgi:murein DD-endopeptidase MepM/ murein hydrolase activator NlpD
MPGGVISGYRADTGLDVMGIKMPVYAIASGFIDYAETGHTLWTGPRDTANCVRIELDESISYRGRRITHIYYAHLSKLEHIQPEGQSPRTRVEAGDLLGTSGVANGSWHLHLGFLLDGEVEQTWGTFLFEDEVREVMGGYRNGNRLPKE